MSSITATDAKNRFGQMLEMAREEPVHIQKNGRDVGIVLSPEQYNDLRAQSAQPRVRPLMEKLMLRSIERRRSLYETLAK